MELRSWHPAWAPARWLMYRHMHDLTCTHLPFHPIIMQAHASHDMFNQT